LNDDQTAAVRAIVTSGNGVDTVQALAGTGKTTMMRVLADTYRDAGYQVIGAAPTARAARELRDVAGVPAGTLHSLAHDLDGTGGFDKRTVLLLDEAGMASTRISAEILAHAEQAGVKVIAVGDSGQLTSVQAGGWFAALTREHAGPGLRKVIRQHNRVERHALAAPAQRQRRPLPRSQGRGHHDPRHRERRNRRRDRPPGRHSHRARSHRRRDDRP
jgi:ATP-dependent exoDNAse (exonuclease V) alpha subunit